MKSSSFIAFDVQNVNLIIMYQKNNVPKKFSGTLSLGTLFTMPTSSLYGIYHFVHPAIVLKAQNIT